LDGRASLESMDPPRLSRRYLALVRLWLGFVRLLFFLAEYFGRLVGTIDDFELIERSAYEW